MIKPRVNSYLKAISVILIFLYSCSGPPNRPRYPNQICASANLCGDLKILSTSNCDNNSYSEYEYILKNNHPSKTVEFLVEFYEQKMDDNWPQDDPVFKESKIYRLKGNTELKLGCQFLYSIPPDDRVWMKRVAIVVQKCFLEDDNCPVISNPVDSNPDQMDCENDCPDPNNPFCISADVCRMPGSWIGDELFSLYQSLSKANHANDRLDVEKIAPQLFSTACKRQTIRLSKRRFLMNGESCDISLPLNSHPKFDGLWLRLPNSLEGEITLTYNQEIVIDFGKNTSPYKAPLFFVTGLNSDNTRFEKEELITSMILTRNSLSAKGENGYCFQLNHCGRINDGYKSE